MSLMYVLLMLSLSICYIGTHQVSSSARACTTAASKVLHVSKHQQRLHELCLTQQIFGLLVYHTLLIGLHQSLAPC